MTQTKDDFLADLRRLVSRWQGDIPKLEAVGERRLADQVRSWIAEAQGIIAAHESIHA